MASVIIAGACNSNSTPQAMPGTDLYAVSPDDVLELKISTPERKLYAFRWSPQDRFELLVARRGAPVEQCVAGGSFMRLLKAVSQLRVVAEVQRAGVEPRRTPLTMLEISDRTALEPITMAFRLTNEAQRQIVVDVGGKQFSATPNGPDFELVLADCSVLSRR